MLKKGDILYRGWLSLDGSDNENCTIEVDEYMVTSIRGGKVYLTEKNKYTWVKVSKTHFDYGWAEKIPEYYKESFTLSVGYKKSGYHRSKAPAYRSTLPTLKKKQRQINSLVKRVEAKISKLKKA